MRRYFKHPNKMPIEFQIDQSAPVKAVGSDLRHPCGLCFYTEQAVPTGSKIKVHIPVEEACVSPASGDASPAAMRFSAGGHVAWCRAKGAGFSVAVSFDESANQYLLRMVEQVCHIESYRARVRDLHGRVLSPDEAASEWISKYAAVFPH